jgi:MFS family permease
MGKDLDSRALKFIILIGVVSLFADMTYEGARSINGQFLAILGASGAVVGFVSGFGELLGYSIRIFSGYISDRTGKYWGVAFTGYLINLLAVPALALAGRWEIAAILMIAERIGKGIRTPARDALLSYASDGMKRGWAFGLHEALDQTGALLGPLILAVILYIKSDYRVAYTFLLVPALIAISVLLTAIFVYPNPRNLSATALKIEPKGYSTIFWLYLVAVALVGASFVDFPLIAYHFKKASVIPDIWIPLFYSIAMVVDGIAALIGGRFFDRIGIKTLAYFAILTSFATPFIFLGGFKFALLGMILWGINLGVQESIMRAAIADMVSIDKRGSAYGIFNTGFGLFWFLGSALMGVLYDISLIWLIIFSVVIQLMSVPIFLKLRLRST